MKNVVIFSTWACPKKLCTRMYKKVGGDGKVGYIPAGLHNSPFEKYPTNVFSPMGFTDSMVFPLGLYYRPYMIDKLLSCDAIAIGGGNTFELLFMLQKRGMLDPLREYVNNGGILMGMSAGGIVMCPSIDIAMFADDNYFGLKDLNGLSLVDFEVKPHFDMWWDAIPAFKKYTKTTKRKLIGLEEGKAIWITDNGVKYYGGMPVFIQ